MEQKERPQMCSNSSQLQRNSLVALEQKHFLLHILGMCRHLLPRPQNSQRPWQISMQTGRRKINHPNNLFTKNTLSLWLGLFLGALRKIEVTLYHGPSGARSMQQIDTQKSFLEKGLRRQENVCQWICWQHDAAPLPHSICILVEYTDVSQPPPLFLVSPLPAHHPNLWH